MEVMKRQRRGKIVNMGSVAGKVAGPPWAHYSASGRHGGFIVLARESPYGVNVNAIAPGDRDRHDPVNHRGDWIPIHHPLGRVGSVQMWPMALFYPRACRVPHREIITPTEAS
jgi:NAD(P)-dependent dehydrogenase (short-subunit alcohol dehydrogenase family)